jgi:hypothetical protein
MSYTTDKNDPCLSEGKADEGLNSCYLILSEEERAKGFVRPVRRSYVHVGVGGHEIDPSDMSKHGRTGNACGALTSMGTPLAETYARNPKFYGATFCVGCNKHLPVSEFVWADTDEVVGS